MFALQVRSLSGSLDERERRLDGSSKSWIEEIIAFRIDKKL